MKNIYDAEHAHIKAHETISQSRSGLCVFDEEMQLKVSNISFNPEGQERFIFSLSINENANVFIFRKGDEKLKSLEDLSGYKTVTEVGYFGATLIEKRNKKKEEIIYIEENFVNQLKCIESGHYDVRIISCISAEKAI